MSEKKIDIIAGRNRRKMEAEVLDRYKIEDSKRDAFKGGGSVGMEDGTQKRETLNQKMERRLLGKNLCFVQRVQLAATAEQAGGAGGSRRDVAATENEDYAGSDEEDQVKR